MKGKGMYYVLTLLVLSSAPEFPLAQLCTELRVITDIGQRLDGHLIFTYDANSLTNCLYECAMVTHCLSINYQVDNKICELNSANSSTASGSDFSANISYKYTDISTWTQLPLGACVNKPCQGRELCLPAPNPVCVDMGCSNSPPTVAGAVITPTGVYYMGDTLSYTCPHTNMYIDGDHTIRCGRLAKWTPAPPFECKRPNNCTTLKLCRSTYTTDGEYWLFPSILSGQKVKVFCRDMFSASPKEYITINPYTNYNYNAGLDYGVGKNWAYFSKIRINIDNLNVMRSHLDFASNSLSKPYAEANDCDRTKSDFYTGEFQVDTTGTGLIVDPNLVWSVGGHASAMFDFTRSNDGRTISATCGGTCGWCMPDDEMYLQINSNEALPDSHATMPSCLVSG